VHAVQVCAVNCRCIITRGTAEIHDLVMQAMVWLRMVRFRVSRFGVVQFSMVQFDVYMQNKMTSHVRGSNLRKNRHLAFE
jgi:hypothetical protein